MNLRMPVVAAIVTAAVAVAAFRSVQHAPSPPGNVAVALESAAPAVPPRAHAHSVASASVTVYVAGDVAKAGVYALPASARAIDAVHAAGGAASDADLVAVNLAEPVTDGEEIVVPVKGADPPVASGATSAGERGRAGHRAHHAKKHPKRRSHRKRAPESETSDTTESDAPVQTVDLNSADENELETLPGIGSSLAARIVTFREVNGPFASPDDLLDVGGMTQGRLDGITPYVTIR